ncbi:MAG TPA: hypothetical protein PLP23_21760 [Panacibacter sp.]|nr:hypothetical protein [Panacibacter sp.]
MNFDILNQKILVKRINPKTIQYRGDLIIEGDKITVKFRWAIKYFSLNQIRKITTYSTVDFGLENHFSCIDIEFERKHKILLDGSLESHQDFINLLTTKLCLSPINWDKDLPAFSDKDRKDILYVNSKVS